MFIGIDLGTSGVKAILMDEEGNILASQTEPQPISRPHPLWSEQDPEDWWQATNRAIRALSKKYQLHGVKALGIAGQMHGAVLLDESNNVLRPAILWNDGRCEEECNILEAEVPSSRQITGNLMMPGFTAPKLLWVKRHEPEIFDKVRKVLLPKDYLRFRITGVFASDMSDAAGTMWLDVAKRDWSDELLAACGLSREHMPSLHEGNEITGYVTSEIASQWEMAPCAVVGGAGDNAAGAIGVEMVDAGSAILSLGTSGVYFTVTDGFLSDPEKAVHSFCHALPGRWHLMSVMLSAASCLTWITNLLQIDSVPSMIALAQTAKTNAGDLYFLPYLSGERTPHNNPNAKGMFFGLTHEHGTAEMALAVLEGVGFGLAGGMDAVHASGVKPESITLIGGGARSSFWRQMLANISGETLDYCTGGDTGPALGAARLAQMAGLSDKEFDGFLPVLELEERHFPDPVAHERYLKKREIFSELYHRLVPLMS